MVFFAGSHVIFKILLGPQKFPTFSWAQIIPHINSFNSDEGLRIIQKHKYIFEKYKGCNLMVCGQTFLLRSTLKCIDFKSSNRYAFQHYKWWNFKRSQSGRQFQAERWLAPTDYQRQIIIFTNNDDYKEVGDHSRGWTEGSLFDSYYTQV